MTELISPQLPPPEHERSASPGPDGLEPTNISRPSSESAPHPSVGLDQQYLAELAEKGYTNPERLEAAEDVGEVATESEVSIESSAGPGAEHPEDSSAVSDRGSGDTPKAAGDAGDGGGIEGPPPTTMGSEDEPSDEDAFLSSLSRRQRQMIDDNHIPVEALLQAHRHGFSLEAVIKAKHDGTLAEQFRENFGVDLGVVEATGNRPYYPDPRVDNIREGERYRKARDELALDLGRPDGAARAQRRMHLHLPLGLHNPLLNILLFGRGSHIGQRILAWQIYLKERGARPATKIIKHPDGREATVPATYNDGFLHVGFNQVRGILDDIEHEEHQVASLNSKLSFMNRHLLNNSDFAVRRDLADKIIRAEQRIHALEERRRVPAGTYEHKVYKDRLSQFNSTPGATEPDPIKYNLEHQDLAKLGARSPGQQSRMEEIRKDELGE